MFSSYPVSLKFAVMGDALAKPEKQGVDPPRSPPPTASQQQHSLISLPEISTCEICIEPMLAPNRKFSNENKCSHPFCEDCMIKYIQAKLEDNIGKIPCPALSCGQFLGPIACRRLLHRQLFVRWCDVLCESALLGFERSYCPNRNCSALIVNECGGNVKKAECPNCKRPFCFQCKLPWHAGFRCEETGELRDRNDRAFGVLAEAKKWMRCPQCHHFVELIDGCKIVRCRCATTFCYNCGRQVNQHWCECQIDQWACFWFFRILLFLIAFLLLFCFVYVAYETYGK